MLRPKSLILPLCALLVACAGTREAERSPTLAHVPTQTLPDGHVAVLVREYDDEVKLDGGREQRMHVRYLWDYTAAVAREIQTAPDGTLLSYAVALLRADKAIDARFTADSDIYGGFSFREPGHEACDVASRCIHVIVSRDGGRYKVAHAIVDLQTARVIDPNYDPALGGVLETPLKAANP
jgi:hypothetical protein